VNRPSSLWQGLRWRFDALWAARVQEFLRVLRYAHPTEEHQFAAMEKRQRYMAK